MFSKLEIFFGLNDLVSLKDRLRIGIKLGLFVLLSLYKIWVNLVF